MTAQIKVKVQRKAIVKLKVLPKFPSDVVAVPGIIITRLGTTYTFSLDPTFGPGALGLVIGTNVQAQDADLQALADNAANGLWARTGAGTGTARTITAPAAGITVSNGGGVAGNPTLALANDLAALEALGSTGIAARTAADTWAQRTITGTAAEITVAAGDGVSGNPTISIPAAVTFTGKTVTGGTFNSPTLVTPALGTPSALVLTNASGLPVSGLASQAAFTFVGNNTSGAAIPTAVSIPGLTSKASPVSGDLVLIADSAASNAWKQTTVGALASAGSVASYNTRTGAVTALGTDVPLRGYLSGLTLSTAGGSGTFGIATGVATDDGNTVMMALASAYTKTIGAWSVGSGNGGLDTGSIASNWYHVFLIERTDTGVVDVLFSLSPTAPTMPTNYTKKRRIGSMLADSFSHWVLFVQQGNQFLWSVPVHDVNSVSDGDTLGHLFGVSVPTGIQVDAIVNGYLLYGSATANGLLTSPDQADTAASGTAYSALVGSASQFAFFNRNLRTNTSAQLRRRASHASAAWDVMTNGWVDNL